MSDLTEFYLNCRAHVAELDCLEISHPDFTQTYRVVRNLTAGGTFTHEDASTHAYVHYPLRLSLTGPRDDLEHILRVELGDLGEILPAEIDAVRGADGFGERPVVTYRTYRSDELTTILYGPLVLEVSQFVFSREGSAFEAKAPSLNVDRTGEVYTLPRFPMLRGLL